MAIESKLQSNIISWLKLNKVYVIKTRPGAGTPVGCPDIIGLYHNQWLAIEVKASNTASFQPGQRYTLELLRGYSKFVYVVYPETWAEVKDDLIARFLTR